MKASMLPPFAAAPWIAVPSMRGVELDWSKGRWKGIPGNAFDLVLQGADSYTSSLHKEHTQRFFFYYTSITSPLHHLHYCRELKRFYVLTL